MDKEDRESVCVCERDGILLSHKELDLAICENMDGPRGYYAKWNKSDREGQIPHDFTNIWNLKTKQTKAETEP